MQKYVTETFKCIFLKFYFVPTQQDIDPVTTSANVEVSPNYVCLLKSGKYFILFIKVNILFYLLRLYSTSAEGL